MRDGVEVHVSVDPEPLTFDDTPTPPRLVLTIDITGIDLTGHGGAHATLGVELDARQAWSIGEHLRDAANAYLAAGGVDQ